MGTDQNKIIYTMTDEAPALATHSLLPIVKAFVATAGIEVELEDISLSGRILAQFPDLLPKDQRVNDALAELGELAKTPRANIIKLPNISASIPQLKAAIAELQSQGYPVPDFPESPSTDVEEATRAKYAKVLGSAVNPVLREGNSDRRVAKPVKEYAKANPHSMGQWSKDSQSHVAHMQQGDFYGSETSYTSPKEQSVKIEWVKADGSTITLKESTPLLEGEIIDAAVMQRSELRAFFDVEISDAKDKGLLLSLHLKATMMKVSDPIMFGHAVSSYFKDLFLKHETTFEKLGINPKNGMGDLEAKIAQLPEDERRVIQEDIKSCYQTKPNLAMVDSDKGITNLHVPSDIIIDASMPAAIRSSGKMWGPDGQLHDTKAMIPDRSYAGIYQAVIEFCKEHGAFDVPTMGNVSNVGLMAKKAEEYGSHDKTFEVQGPGSIQVVDAEGTVVLKHVVDTGDIWRMCQTKDVAVKDWVRLAVNRARSTGSPAVFWLDSERAHDSNLIGKVEEYLKEHNTDGLTILVKSPVEAMKYTLERVKNGEDTISVTGNVLRDYLTDLFPILELGTSAKMLSIVPLLAGGGLFETGAGGSAPKHVQQFLEEGHLRWDSLGEFLALAVSLEELGEQSSNTKISTLATALDRANSQFLKENKSPSRKVKEIDTRGSHFYLGLYWAQALSEQSDDIDLQARFKELYVKLKEKEGQIAEELIQAQGSSMDIGGYYRPNTELTSKAMRPSATFNSLLAEL